MDGLILQNFRCFVGYQEIPLRPLTLLVGENSSGKTSFLAASRIAEYWRSRYPIGGVPPNFNEEPFFLGTFDELASYRRGKAGRADTFRIGSAVKLVFRTVRLISEFMKVSGRPAIKRFELSSEDYEIALDFSSEPWQCLVRTPSQRKKISLGAVQPGDDPWQRIGSGLVNVVTSTPPVISLSQTEKETLNMMIACWIQRPKLPAYAAAPIRAQPKRTYEPLSDTPRAQGDHVPVLLAQIYGQAEWEELREPLEQFARASGLFDEITVKRLGKGESSPFQIHVKVGGPPRNLIDVGYGVSQILPVLVDLLRDKHPRMYLIQQPEVHLHPRAQAELGTLLATISKTRSKQLLIETHSDYIIDRVRMEVRKGTIKPADAIILYFERERSEVTVHPIEMDENGNLLETPPSYRSFFLEEEGRFLGLADVHHH
jgi:hypothetical protein